MHTTACFRICGIVSLIIGSLILTTCGKNTRPADETSAFNADTLRVLNDSVEVDAYPEMIHMESPIYPRDAKLKGITGTVWVRVLVDKSGHVVKSEIAHSSGSSLLDDSALNAAHKCLFKPALKDGRPHDYWITYKIDFQLD